jgi:cytochrome P450
MPPIDLISASSFANGQPHVVFRWMRENDPVHWHEQTNAKGFWAVTRYHDVWAIGRDAKTYSSYAGGIGLDDAPEVSLQLTRNMMLHMDPPNHTRYRALVSREFIPRSANALRPRIEELAKKIIDEVIERGECDLMPDIAGVLPSYVIAELMGIPPADGRRLYTLTEKMHSASEVISEHERSGALMEMLRYALDLAEAKRRHPGDDIATKLLEAEIDGDHLTPSEYSFFFLLLINAGGDTTRNLLGGGMLVQ